MSLSDAYRLFPNQVMTEVKDYDYPIKELCLICKTRPVKKQVCWINAKWTGQYNFRYVCDDLECIDKARQSFVFEMVFEQEEIND